MSANYSNTGLVWFRNDLRVHDNLSLSRATKHDNVLAVYFFDPRHYQKGPFGFRKTEKFRAKFLIETITELRKNLEHLGIPLLIFNCEPETKMNEIIWEYGVKAVYLQKEWTQEESETLEAVIQSVPTEVSFEESYDQFLFHPQDIPFEQFRNIPNVFTKFRKECEKYSSVRPCLPVPGSLTQPATLKQQTSIPTLEDLGFQSFERDPRSAFPFSGGEDQAKLRVQNYFWETRKLSYYKHTRNGLVGKDYSSKLSPWLANGSTSPRYIYWEVKKYEKEVVKNQDTYWLIFELIWRDYFKYVSLKYGNHIFRQSGILNKDYNWYRDDDIKESWINGTTREPFVNANMKELAATGWMSNRGRQNVASYWAKELEQDWRIGAAYFESMLLDYDVHSNWGNWMYNSGVGNDPRDRKFNVRLQADRYDGDGKFQRLWLQERLF
ncbi:DASH family cryptochrome [Lentiprolixibacter aurantiacus]|uniref:Cryptochrome DASH n=1 Tax=Lentiprolixibacter aurantiacus TaxID=2993939 RepID=A0AAE3MLV1_9FLAO|nr:DASH family cryptochrome [Lentiprolixibacter aurantiacus]MCX2719259.1 DASH family cryptochrome [Lentiprolixibacter aurantiacus]